MPPYHIASVHSAACRTQLLISSLNLTTLDRFLGTFAHMVRPPPSCLIPKQHGRRHYCLDTSSILRAVRGSMVVDDRARGACNTHSKYSSEDFSDSAGALGRIASTVYGVLLFMNAGLAAWAGVSVVLVSVV